MRRVCGDGDFGVGGRFWRHSRQGEAEKKWKKEFVQRLVAKTERRQSGRSIKGKAMPDDETDSPPPYVVLAPGVILSEHSTLAEARRARGKAVKEGFVDAVVLKRTEQGLRPT